MENIMLWCFLAALLAIAINRARSSRPDASKLDVFPSVGCSGLLSSYWGAVRFLLWPTDMLREGYIKYKGKAFKVPSWFGWDIIVSGPCLMEDIKRAPEDYLASVAAVNPILKVDQTARRQVSQLARFLDDQLPDIRDEIVASFDDNIHIQGDEWVSIPAYDMIHQVICRTSNRAFVGLPLCRNPEWIALNLQFTHDVLKESIATYLLPSFMTFLITRFLTEPSSMQRGIQLLQPMVEKRRKNMDEFGNDWAEKPNDLLAWIMEDLKAEEDSIRNLVTRIMTVNFTANSDTAMIFTHVLFYLAAHPEYVDELREELELAVEEDGWSKPALARMHKTDSFIREILRIECIGFTSVIRKALKDFTFSDGTVVPAGCFISVASFCTHKDEEIYDRPDDFRPFRFVTNSDGVVGGNQMVSIGTEYMPFGLGRHSCPGRHFISNVMKAMLAHIVLTYDVKLEDGIRPPNAVYGVVSCPNAKAKVMFKRRNCDDEPA